MHSAIKRYVVVSIIILNVVILYYLFIYSKLNKIVWINHLTPSIESTVTSSSKSNYFQLILSPPFTYSLDSECKSNLNDSISQKRMDEFNDIFEKRRWNQVGSRSGPGSSLEGAFDWIKHLRKFIEHYSIRSIADIPCGDTYWQFSIREVNTIQDIYFGGDISTSVIKQNQILYGSKHLNKLFHYWDLVRCSIPRYTFKNSTHELKGNEFDLVIVRDAIQHMHIKNGLKAVKNVIMSGAKYFAVSTFPPNGKSSASNTRSIEKNEPLPSMPIDCANKNYCTLGNIREGDVYHNNINCYPFNFPLNKSILVQPSHERFSEEPDEMHIYKVDDELKKIVAEYDKACLS